jgi:hypothetical protein
MFGVSREEVDSLEEYNSKLDDMVVSLMASQKITKEEALQAIQSSDTFGKFEGANATIDKMAFNLSGGNEEAKAGLVKDLRGIYESLSESDKTLFLGLDFTDLSVENLSEST